MSAGCSLHQCRGLVRMFEVCCWLWAADDPPCAKCDELPKSPAIIWLKRANALSPPLAVWSVEEPAAGVAGDFEPNAAPSVFAVLAKSGWLSNHCETSMWWPWPH